MVTAELPDQNPIEANIAVKPASTFACRITDGDTHLTSSAAEAGSFLPAQTPKEPVKAL